MMQRCILVFSMLAIFPTNGLLELPPQFWKILNLSQAPEAVTIKIKIYQTFYQVSRQTLVFEEGAKHYDDYMKCYPRLLHIMADDLKCPRAADDIKLYLGIMEFQFNMTFDDKFLWSIFESNCTNLNGRTANICDLIVSRGIISVGYDEFSNILNDCKSEQQKNNGGQNKLLSDR